MLSAQRLLLNSELGKSKVCSGEHTWVSWNQGTAPAASVQNSASKVAKMQSHSKKKGDEEKPFKKTKAWYQAQELAQCELYQSGKGKPNKSSESQIYCQPVYHHQSEDMALETSSESGRHD